MTPFIENRTIDEIKVGDQASLTRAMRLNDVESWAAVTGNINLLDFDGLPPDDSNFDQGSGQAMWAAALFATIAGTDLPGFGSIVSAMSVRFHRPIPVGENLTATVTVTEIRRSEGIIGLDCRCADTQGELLVSGSAEVIAPKVKIRRAYHELPQVRLRREDRYLDLVQKCEGLPPMATVIVHPCSDDALSGAVTAAERNLIIPILVGPEAKIRSLAAAHDIDISPYRLIPSEHSHHSAEVSVAMVRNGEAQALMKGSLHTDELLSEVVRKDSGLRTERRLSHCFLVAVPTYARPIIVTDAAINILPTLEDKVDIVQNAIELAQALGIVQPKVAILSAVETVTHKIPSTLDAAALCKMAERGQIRGGLLDGPLAFDNAIDEEAARTKGIVSAVAGKADILVVPDLEAGNMLAKQLTYMADADAAGIVLGARAPIILTSRADNSRTRLASCAVAVLYTEAQRKGAVLLKSSGE